ncbi:MAG: lipopolysaccharide biosynthesis protein [Fastidiosipila sp.]|jgi:teichuronic acid exporter|nr:lipopolysaccharide biosynthesis protein [Fastidiosipila sp.]
MGVEINKSRIISSLFWKFMERGGSQAISFLISIALARLLMPEDYGTIALVTVFTSIAALFVESGFGTALIQKKEVDEVDYSSVFFVNLSISLLLYAVLFLMAPSISRFYKIPEITPIIRVLSVTLIFGALNAVQNAIISRTLQFKLLFVRSTGALVISGTVGIALAYAGFGVWALVWQSIANRFFITAILWFTLRWRPHFQFSTDRVKEHFSFGWKVLAASLLTTGYREARSLIIGKMYQPATLGYYNRGSKFPSLIVSNIDGSIQAVMFPVLASQQDNRSKVKSMMRRSITSSSFIVFPLMVGLAVISEPLVLLLMTEKWLPAVPYIRIFCASYALYPIHSANLEAIKGLGYSGTYLRLNVIRRIIGILILIITAFWGPYAIALGQVLNGIIASFVNAHPNKKLLLYGYKEQITDILPSLILSIVMGSAIFCLRWVGLAALPTMVLQILFGLALYVVLAKILGLESYRYLVSAAKDFFKRKSMGHTNEKN